jgi:hypothetical protein
MFEEYDVVRLVSDLESSGLKTGTRGAIVMIYPSDPPEYEVEFVDEEGNTLAIETVKAGQIEKTSWGREETTGT